MKQTIRLCLILFLFLGVYYTSEAQKITAETLSGLEFRNIGPALTSGRIADIAIDPTNENVWYVAVGSGGVWKTTNAGTTWTPIFDKQTSYSIGCITIDPGNPHTIWVGTGENVGGRHVAFGDGIYKSTDNGATWKHMGLKNSEHLSKIVVHPEDPNTVWVASQGPLWSKGGERGVYKSTDGGKTWNRTLGDDEWIGATDILIDPKNPDVLYAATWQRHRTVAAYLGGGPGSGIHKSTDGGNTWRKLKNGIPASNLGKIGLAMSPFNSDVLYAAIELDRTTGGVYMSTNRGESWTRQSNAVSGGTGPHYYQELYASPHHEGQLFLMSNVVQMSDDHGRNFRFMNENNKHVDSHAMAFKSSDPNYILFGTDGGLYETFDLTTSWKYVRNLPITQFYKVAVDDAEPFYNVYGGTQDNGSQGGPSRTTSAGGIINSDWKVVLGADGHQSATEPGNPDITYGEFQQGWLWRIDQTTGETVFIQPQPAEGEPAERFNWDAPILVSPHNPTRLYFASQRVWRSENRGDEWTAISGDLTRDENRMQLPYFGKQQSWDNAWDLRAMSNYNTITSLAESPIQEGLLYAGTDDGYVQVSEDGGANWRSVDLSKVKGLPSRPFVNDIRADLYDANVVYLTLDNHKYGDFKPYLLKSTDKGRTWSSINGDLPKRLVTWRLVQDHVKKDLLFAATEFGVYFTTNGGKNWLQLKGGIPTIAIRDITIQRRENDLVAASFGRGFYILDDITPLRNLNASMDTNEATMFPVKDAYWYVQRAAVYAQGDNEYRAQNHPFGAVFTYYMPEKLKSLKDIRVEKEKKGDVTFPEWSELETETRQQGPQILLVIKDSNGNLVNTVTGTNRKGFNRVSWGLNYPNKSGERLVPPAAGNSFFPTNMMVTPGTYTVTIMKRVDGKTTELQAPVSFNVVPLSDGALPRKSNNEINQFREEFQNFQQDLTATNLTITNGVRKVDAMMRAANKATGNNDRVIEQINNARIRLLDIQKAFSGDPVKGEIGERNAPSPNDASFISTVALTSGTYGPTGTHKKSLNRAKKQLSEIKAELKGVTNQLLPGIERELKAIGAPWIEGQGLIDN